MPSVTETLLAWGVVPVAVTRFCEQPHLRAVGGTKNPDIGAIVELAPDVVLVNREENRREDAAALAAAGVPLHVVDVDQVADVGPALDALAERVGVGSPALLDVSPLTPLGLRAFVPIWRMPWMTISASTYGWSVLEVLGIEVIAGDGSGRYPEVGLDTVAAAHPDVVLAPSEPYHFTERHRDELEQVAPVVFVDGQDLFWWGVRTATALGRLHRVISGAAGSSPM